MTEKGNGKQFERQAKGEDGRQGELETRSVTGKVSGKQFKRLTRGTGDKECGQESGVKEREQIGKR